MDWIPLTAEGAVKQFYHLSTTDTDRAALFNLYRDALLQYIAQWGAEIDIDDEMLPFFLALEPRQFADFDTPELLHKYALQSEYFFDRSFLVDAFAIAGKLRGLSPEVLARYILSAIDGMWLMYRFSSLGAGSSPPVSLEEARVSVSLVRIRPHKHLSPFETKTPRFIYESDASNDGIMRVDGHFYPSRGRIYFLGQRARQQQDQGSLAPIAFNWLLPEDLSAAPHMTSNTGVAYGVNSSGERIAFRFLALFIAESNRDNKVVFEKKVETYKQLVGVYPAMTLDTELRAALATAQRAHGSESPRASESRSQVASELPLPLPTQDDLNDLFRRSREDIVLKSR